MAIKYCLFIIIAYIVLLFSGCNGVIINRGNSTYSNIKFYTYV
ncbi:conserved Plasmodium protein, unknown function [Plasmodium vinckei vinckei]|uniref:Uncharacterized protein n=1 Tax=Plasmodium vinckei vinckei TaxID=54757 RepID=A0A449BPL3_PLAVN|nr:conserved Plasmodium protein, unknown function [Plasmodium vinckei vinckei]VEV55417.1 conserved Plasmodium protein, unknown function [Plasmodium vinckei vinckei]